MAERKKIRTCICCGKEYEFCYHCGSRDNKLMWKNNYDTEACRDIFNAITDYRAGAITKAEAAEILNSYKARENKYNPEITEQIVLILGKPNAAEKKQEKKDKASESDYTKQRNAEDYYQHKTKKNDYRENFD